MSKKKVAIIGTVGVPANYGGYETMVDNILDYTPEDVFYTVYCSSKAYNEKKTEYKGARLVYIPFKANGTQAIIYDACSILHAYFKNDTLLLLGSAGTWVLPILKIIKKKRIILNYDGYETVRKKWTFAQKVVLSFLRKNASRYANIHVADNEAIAPLIKEQYNVDSHIIEYGGDGAFKVNDDRKLKEKYNLMSSEYYFNVARIEPENNIHLILEAFAQMPDKQLVLVGNWHNNQYGEDLMRKYGAFPNIIMFNPIYNKDEINLLRSNCKVYIHPHSVGGTNPSLVEAMYLGLPIVAFNVIYNVKTTEGEALYFDDSHSLAGLIRNTSNEELNRIATKMSEIANRRYLWKVISEKYVQLF